MVTFWGYQKRWNFKEFYSIFDPSRLVSRRTYKVGLDQLEVPFRRDRRGEISPQWNSQWNPLDFTAISRGPMSLHFIPFRADHLSDTKAGKDANGKSKSIVKPKNKSKMKIHHLKWDTLNSVEISVIKISLSKNSPFVDLPTGVRMNWRFPTCVKLNITPDFNIYVICWFGSTFWLVRLIGCKPCDHLAASKKCFVPFKSAMNKSVDWYLCRELYSTQLY